MLFSPRSCLQNSSGTGAGDLGLERERIWGCLEWSGKAAHLKCSEAGVSGNQKPHAVLWRTLRPHARPGQTVGS